MKTSIIILTFNQLHYTKACIESIRRYTDKHEYELIVVDNQSTDGTVDWLRKQKDIKVICNEENVGFPKGCNQGIQIATGDNILLLNNDVIVTVKWLDNLVRCLYSAVDIGAVGPITNSASYYQAINVHYKSEQEMQLFARTVNRSNPNLWEERLKLVGFCMMIKRTVLDQVGLLDEAFSPGNFEDDDLSYRIRLAGFRLLLCRDTFIHHYGSVSFKQNNEKFVNLLKENRKKFEKKWGYDPVYSTLIRTEVASLISHPENSKLNILEVGCACGGTLLYIKNKYANSSLYGIEINRNAAKSTALFAQVSDQDIEKLALSFQHCFFDYILLPDVLEHLQDPWKVLEMLKKYLKPNGKLLISLPNVMHFSVIKKMLHGYWTYEDAGILDKTHLRFFTLKEIDKYLKELGYSVREYQTTSTTENEQDTIFINKIAELAGIPDIEKQYRAYQYIFAAELKEEIKAETQEEQQFFPDIELKQDNREVILLLKQIENDIEKEKSLNMLIKLLESGLISLKDIIHVTDTEVLRQEELLQIIAVSCFERGLVEGALTLLEKAFYLNNQNTITVYNLAYIVYKAGEAKIALGLLEQLEKHDEEIVELISEIENSLHESA
ncbi:bifunctional glycosyltransferase family 2 protein/class I SAM-dependent methyltransferase [Anaerospora hongkongensis]|uniref:bifunctional glycosyltransferase family 2 protein/class I SAM-dependent methyltransferase n=1 Tax=Anaerospora hongkongensis TaxID=244830 RepID=UPI0028A12E13|nr:bifunctional glycosyltransferase family 2 protein/class I SAM-dependent methyltransferase [Anaerospora hongkongensis]